MPPLMDSHLFKVGNMKLIAGDKIYKAHFKHSTYIPTGAITKPSGRLDQPIDLRRPETTCTIHEGECKDRDKGGFCLNDQLIVGTVRCYFKDQYTKAAGRRMAFARAISDFPRDIRAQLWRSYNVQHPPEKETKPRAA